MNECILQLHVVAVKFNQSSPPVQTELYIIVIKVLWDCTDHRALGVY